MKAGTSLLRNTAVLLCVSLTLLLVAAGCAGTSPSVATREAKQAKYHERLIVDEAITKCVIAGILMEQNDSLGQLERVMEVCIIINTLDHPEYGNDLLNVLNKLRESER